jgi:hypothetical protein
MLVKHLDFFLPIHLQLIEEIHWMCLQHQVPACVHNTWRSFLSNQFECVILRSRLVGLYIMVEWQGEKQK